MKIGAFGEVMLRLTPPEHLMLEQTHTLRMAYTGTGVNLVGNLAHFGVDSYLLTTLPNNRLGEAALSNLKGLGIHTEYIAKNHQHIGTYFAEMGYGARATHVTYQNRHNSSFGLSQRNEYAISEFIEAVDLVHICGISLSLTEATAETAIYLAKKAYEQGKTVCFDFNFRPSLNLEDGKKELMKKRYEEILAYSSIVFGSVRDLTDLLKIAPAEEINSEAQETALIRQFLKDYKISWFAGTKRKTTEGKKSLSGYLITEDENVRTPEYTLEILDRIGAGDAYAAGILLGHAEKWALEKTSLFAVGNAILAHTIQGDVPLTTREQVRQVLEEPDRDLIR